MHDPHFQKKYQPHVRRSKVISIRFEISCFVRLLVLGFFVAVEEEAKKKEIIEHGTIRIAFIQVKIHHKWIVKVLRL